MRRPAKAKGPTHSSVTFSTAEAFLAALMAAPVTDAGRTYREQHERSMANSSEHGVASLQDAAALARAGVAPHFSPIAAASTTAAMSSSLRPRRMRAVAGGAPCVPDVLSGRPDCMRRTMRKPAIGAAIRIRVVSSYSSHTPVSVIERHGAQVLAAVDSLVRSGNRVELWVTHGSESSRKGTRHVDVCVKGADAPLDWQRAAFHMCHVASLRALYFAYQDAQFSQADRAAFGDRRGATLTHPHLPLEAGPAYVIAGLGHRGGAADAADIVRRALEQVQ